MEKEIWNSIPGYEGMYEVSNLGRIKSKRRKDEHILSPYNTGNGYLQVDLSIGKQRKVFLVHRLVLKAFYPESNNLQVNHKNGIKTDNRLENLEWCTSSENHKHSFRELGRNPTKFWIGKCGENNPSSKPILQYSKDGIFIAEYANAVIAMKITGINKGHIASCCCGKRKSAGGYLWKHKLLNDK